MSYRYLGVGSTTNSARYRITLRLFRECSSDGARLDTAAAITIYQTGSTQIYQNLLSPIDRVDVVTLSSPGPCITNAPIVCYQIGTYEEDIELPFNIQGYTITYQRCCRIENITNVLGSGSTGGTYTATIPGTTVFPQAPVNSTPVFTGVDTVLICQDNPFVYDFGAVDADGDSLVYVFDEAYDFANQNNPQPGQAAPPPYESLPYTFGYSALSPMGPEVTLNGNTGLMSGIAPAAGIYVVTVSVIEYRQGELLNRHRKDLHIKVAPCTIAAADLDPEYVSCDDFQVTFQNRSSSPLIQTYFWDFGVPGAGDTANIARPTFTFPDTGVYRVTLITNRGQDCSDTAVTIARVFPGFNANFDVLEGCRNVPLRFFDRTTATYGTVNLWRWTFGYPQVNPEGSMQQNPTYIYPEIGAYDVQFIVGSSKGCRDTVERTVNVLAKPPLLLSNDTILCNLDTIRLSAIGNGTITWSPNIAISDVSSTTPLVSPDQSITYYATLSSAPGCENIDSVFIDVRSSVNLDAGSDTTICLTDPITLSPISDGLTYRWTPAATLSDPLVKNPIATPVGTTTYNVIANIGRCQASDAVTIRTVPYPNVQASPDQTICFGESVQLQVSGGETYRWIPSTGLSANDIPNPIASPTQTIVYRVAARESLGCPKAAFDTVVVTVIPPVPAFAGNDTTVVVGQPLQLNASGGDFYQWSPSTGLTNPNIADPIANLNDDIRFILRVETTEGCVGLDTLNVRVFKTDPDIFVPTAFTPNADGLNDLLIPIPAGISEFEYFRVYNRYGQLVFSTTETGKGWDGKIDGKDQGSDTFAWYVKGRSYTGKTIFKKGISTLIR